MIVMMVIGFITMRIILKALGITDWGVYSLVGGILTLAMLVMNTVSSAITRFITVGLGKGDMERLATTFGTSFLIMAAFCVAITLLTETVGVWYLGHKLVIPEGRMAAAGVVLQTSLIVLVINLLSVPFTAVINAHEHMGAYAFIAILEAVLKLAVALGVWYSPADKLITYAWLLVAVAILARGAYVLYSVLHFEETRHPLRSDKAIVREMGGFAGWNFLASGAYMLNTQGINQLMNPFFGITANAARGVADKVEQVVRQFATNIALAVNPQLTKSYVSGSKEYSFDLVCKGSKYYFWVLWVIAIPFFTDAETILHLWLGETPPQAALFTRLALLCFIVDFTPGTMNILQQAHGNIRKYYLITTGVAVLAFPLTWLAFRLGAPSWAGYVIFTGIYILKAAAMLAVVHHDLHFSVRAYCRKALLPILAGMFPALVLIPPLCLVIPVCWWRFLVIAIAGLAVSALGIWLWGLTPGEKAFVRSKLPWRHE